MLLTHLRPQMTEADGSADAWLLDVLDVGATCGMPTRRCRTQWTRSTSELAMLALCPTPQPQHAWPVANCALLTGSEGVCQQQLHAHAPDQPALSGKACIMSCPCCAVGPTFCIGCST
jgi:hypothetical protein